MSARGGFIVASGLGLAAACGAEEIPLPEYSLDASGVTNPKTCVELRTAGVPDELDVLIDGEPAACLGDGVSCSLADIDAFDGTCAIGVTTAVCVGSSWQLRCDQLDAGTPDASPPLDATAE